MASLAIKLLIVFLELLEIIALHTSDERLMDQLILVRDAFVEAGWKR